MSGFAQAIPEISTQLVHLGQGRSLDVALPGIKRCVILMVGLGLEKLLQRLQTGDDLATEDAGLLQLLDVAFRHLLL